jgi:hypothetical protein
VVTEGRVPHDSLAERAAVDRKRKSGGWVCIRYGGRCSVQVSSKDAGGSASSRRQDGEPVATTKFVLKHQQVEVDYTLSAPPTLVYQDGSITKTFTGPEILTDQTGLRTLVSVALVLTIDVGGERFGVFLPQLDLMLDLSVEFHTVGVYERFSGPDSLPREPSWRCIELSGTAQGV